MNGSAGVEQGTRAVQCASLASRIFRLASPEGRRLLQALVLMVEVNVQLRLVGFARFQKALRRPLSAAHATRQVETLLRDARDMAQALRRAERCIPRACCLHRALALMLWLRRQGVVADLCIGIQASGESLDGHAWVEWRGMPLDEDRAVCQDYGLLEQAKGARFVK
jgi:Transglutaminase-like superfamily